MNNKLTTFYVGSNMYGIEASRVQEVTGPAGIVPVPLAPHFVRGLINLRGQIATALGLREFFKLQDLNRGKEMSVVCRTDGHLISFLVDNIGDVIEVEQKNFEKVPETLPSEIRPYIKGIFKVNETLLSVLDVERLSKELTLLK